MKFLVVLICVSANYFWSKDFDRIDDAWFFRLRHGIDKAVKRHSERHASAWAWGILLIFLIPLSVLILVLLLLNGVLFGLLTLVVHVMVLLMAFDRIHPGLLAEEYLARWRAGDLEGSCQYLQQELTNEVMVAPVNVVHLHRRFCRLYVYSCFEKMFVMFFWYLITGSLGVLFAYICYQLRDSETPESNPHGAKLIAGLIAVLEWVPLRLVGMTFCLAGNFEACFQSLRRLGLKSETGNDYAVYDFAVCALDLNQATPDGVGAMADPESGSDAAPSESSVSTPPFDASEFESFKEPAEREIHALQAMMERSQIIWLCGFAVSTIIGLGI